MGKLFNVAIGGIAITLGLLIFNSAGFTPSNLILMLLNPESLTSTDPSGRYSFFALLFGIATVTGFIAIGIAAIIKQDWVARGGIVLGLNSVLIAPYIDLFRAIVSQTKFIGTNFTCQVSPLCSYIQTGGIGQIIAFIFVGPLIFYCLWACLEWVWKGDS